MKMRNIGEVICALRKECKMTQEELANRIGMNRVTIAKIENSQRALSLEEAISISEVFSISIDRLYELINDDEESNIAEEPFVMAFKSKGMGEKDLLEIKRIELLMDALKTQREILWGE